MTTIHQFAIQLAEAIAPNEVELAPSLVEDFIHPGTCYTATNKAAEIEGLYSLNPDGMLILPMVLSAISAAAQLLKPLLNLSKIQDTISIVKEALEIKAVLTHQSVAESTSPHTSIRAALLQAIDIMQDELVLSGLPDEQAELITFRILKRLLSNPQGGLEFMNAQPDE